MRMMYLMALVRHGLQDNTSRSMCNSKDTMPYLVQTTSSLLSSFHWPSKHNCVYKGSWMNINVNVYVYSLISPCVRRSSQFTPLVLDLSLIRSHLLCGEFSTFSAANDIHNAPIFVSPGTHRSWVGRGSMD